MVIYDETESSNAHSSRIKYEYSTLILTSTMPTENGYSFLDWSTDKDAISAAYFCR